MHVESVRGLEGVFPETTGDLLEHAGDVASNAYRDGYDMLYLPSGLLPSTALWKDILSFEIVGVGADEYLGQERSIWVVYDAERVKQVTVLERGENELTALDEHIDALRLRREIDDFHAFFTDTTTFVVQLKKPAESEK